MAYIPALGDIVATIQTTGKWRGKAASVWHVLGRRAGWATAQVLNDVKEYNATGGGATALIVDLAGTEPLEVVSSSANDAAAGTGAGSVKVTYVDSTTGLITTSAEIVLNGVTAVAAGFTAKAILCMEVFAPGQTQVMPYVAAGNITLRNATDHTTNYEQISAGNGKSLSAYFMVPTGSTGYLVQWNGATQGAGDHDVRMRATVMTGDRSLCTPYHFQGLTNIASPGGIFDEALGMLRCPALSRIKVSVIPSATAATNRLDVSVIVIVIAD